MNSPSDNRSEVGGESPPPNSAPHEIAATSVHIHTEHKQTTTAQQSIVDRLTAFVGRPRFILVLAGAIALWIAANLLLRQWGLRVPDPPPFVWLEGVVSTAALFMSASIFITQRHEDILAGHRTQLLLELLVVNDRKIAKIIQLIEEVRRDTPIIKDRVDGEAAAMATPSDPHAVLKAIKEVAGEEGP